MTQTPLADTPSFQWKQLLQSLTAAAYDTALSARKRHSGKGLAKTTGRGEVHLAGLGWYDAGQTSGWDQTSGLTQTKHPEQEK